MKVALRNIYFLCLYPHLQKQIRRFFRGVLSTYHATICTFNFLSFFIIVFLSPNLSTSLSVSYFS